jgi:hypothetical protein
VLPVQEAALEKARAGEGRNVEHVALETDATLLLAAQRTKPRRSGRASSGKRPHQTLPKRGLKPHMDCSVHEHDCQSAAVQV